MRNTWLRWLAVAGLIVGGVACGGGDDEVVVPTAADLAEDLIDVDTFDGDWTVNVPPGVEDAETGIVTDEKQEMLPSLDLCDEATDASRAAAESVEWMAFRQIDLQLDDPIEPPDDLSGNMVSVQEFLTAGEPDEIENLFELLRDGTEACLGEIPAGEEGPGVSEEIELPDIGDDRFGALNVFAEAGDWAEWRIHGGLIRDTTVLAMITVIDIRADADPYYTPDQVGDMMATAVELL
jgi:hypothetical protein